MRRGVTLLELLLVLAIATVVVGVVGVSFTAPSRRIQTDPAFVIIEELRSRAIRTGRPTTAKLQNDSGTFSVTAYPDSRVLGEHTLDPLSGRRRGVTP